MARTTKPLTNTEIEKAKPKIDKDGKPMQALSGLNVVSYWQKALTHKITENNSSRHNKRNY